MDGRNHLTLPELFAGDRCSPWGWGVTIWDEMQLITSSRMERKETGLGRKSTGIASNDRKHIRLQIVRNYVFKLGCFTEKTNIERATYLTLRDGSSGRGIISRRDELEKLIHHVMFIRRPIAWEILSSPYLATYLVIPQKGQGVGPLLVEN